MYNRRLVDSTSVSFNLLVGIRIKQDGPYIRLRVSTSVVLPKLQFTDWSPNLIKWIPELQCGKALNNDNERLRQADVAVVMSILPVVEVIISS